MSAEPKHFKKAVVWLLLAGMLLWMLTACGGSPDISTYSDMAIIVKGLEEEDVEITPSELMEMDCVSGSDTGSSDKAGTIEGYGPTLDTFLAEYGKKRTDFSKVKFMGKDGYIKTIWGEMLEEKEIVLSIANGEEPLKDNETPIRLLVPGADSSYWVYGVNEIEFIE